MKALHSGNATTLRSKLKHHMESFLCRLAQIVLMFLMEVHRQLHYNVLLPLVPCEITEERATQFMQGEKERGR